MNKRIVAAFMTVCLLLVCIGNNSNAVQSTSYRQMIEDAKKQTDEAQQKLDQVKGEIDSELQEIENINTSITELENDITQLTNDITSLNTSIEEKENDLEEKQALLDERLSVAYMNNNNAYLEALFTGGFIKFLSNYDMIKQIAEYDTNLINEVKGIKASLEEEKANLEQSISDKKTKTAELNSLKEEKQGKVDSLTEEQKEIQAQVDEYNNQMEVLEAKERALSMQYSTGTGIVASSGALAWPVPLSKNISSVYGNRVHPISGTVRLHAGIDIAAPGGTEIVAAESGTVYLASTGYNGGYGNYVIIDHGNGLTTRYAHCSVLCVTAGQSVTKGQKIAEVGTTGASTGNHCHFEVRINGESTNPLNYL